MQIGVHVPQLGADTDPQALRSFAQAMEAAGADSLWVSDHVIFPRRNETRMDYAEGGTFPAAWVERPLLEPLAALAFLAAVTSRVRLGISVLVLPMRNPVITAKTLASIDTLSGGRLILDAGIGWLREEYEALGAIWEKRGERFEAYLQIIDRLWTEDDTAIETSVFSMPNVGCYPKTAQHPRPPVWIGGNSAIAMRRAARLGDGWHTISLSIAQVAELLPRYRAAASAAGRTPAQLVFSLRDKLDLEGPVEPVISFLRRLRDLGTDHFVISTGFGSQLSVIGPLRRRMVQIVPALAKG